MEFDLQAIFDGELYSDFALLWLTCHRTRFEGDPPEKCLLEQWSQHAASAGTRALDRLRDGVEDAIACLGEGFLAHPANTELRRRLVDGETSTTDYQHQLLRVVYRLLFLLVAESRDLLLGPDTDEVDRARYREFYSISRLVGLARVRRGSTHHDLWSGLQVTMRALWRDGEPALGLTPLGSFLWSPESLKDLSDAKLDNRHLLEAVRRLTLTRDTEAKIDRAVDYRNLGAEELGSIYESLLELHAQVDVPARRFALGSAAGNERKTTGSYYTPTSLINELLDSALDPVLEEAARSHDPVSAILELSVLDPACGSGHFLIAAANRIAQRLAGVRAGGIEPAPDEVRTALRDVVGRCLHGIDVNPMAVELCKVSLWLEATEPGKPLSFLDHRIVCGNALLGTTPKLLADGIPDEAFTWLEGDDKKTASELKKRNKGERKGQGSLGLFDDSVAGVTKPVMAAIEAIDAVPDDTAEQIARKAELLAELERSPEATKATLAADAWCAAFVAPKAKGEPPITTATVRQILDDPARVPADVIDRIRSLASEYRFLHLHLAFPDVVSVPEDVGAATNERTGWDGGFSVLLGNPPWDMVQLSEKEFFSEHSPNIANASGAKRKSLILKLRESDPGLFASYLWAIRYTSGIRSLLCNSGRFPLCGRGRVNTYSVFSELMRDAVNANTGRVGAVIPSGIATDDTTKLFFHELIQNGNIDSLFEFENTGFFNAGKGHMLRFALLTLDLSSRRSVARFMFRGQNLADLSEPERIIQMNQDTVRLLNPNTNTCPIFSTEFDRILNEKIYRTNSILHLDDASTQPSGYELTFRQGVLNATTDSGRFLDRQAADGHQAFGSSIVVNGTQFVPVWQAKMIDQWNHRRGSYENVPPNSNPHVLPAIPDSDLADPSHVCLPRYWVPNSFREDRLAGRQFRDWLLGWRDVTDSRASERTTVAAILPFGAPDGGLLLAFPASAVEAATLVANWNSFAFDYLARQKVANIHLKLFTMKQIPVVPFARLSTAAPWSTHETAAEYIKRRVLELTVTCWDITSFAVDLGESGVPYKWDPERRRVLAAELDAAFFHLYGISREEANYIMDSFVIVRRRDEEMFGCFYTKELILEAFDLMSEAILVDSSFDTTLTVAPASQLMQHSRDDAPFWANSYPGWRGLDRRTT